MKKIIVMIAVIALLITGCGSSQPVSSAQPQVNVFESSQQPAQPTVDPEIEKQKLQEQQKAEEPAADGTEFIPEDTGIEFTTPYINLKYPEELQGKVELIHNTEGDKHTVTFKAADGDITLFSMIFSLNDGEPGFKLGMLKDPAKGTVNIFTDMNDISPEGLSEEKYNELCAMQERVNDLIGQLSEDERFDTGR